MRLSQLLGKREKEAPREAQLISHQFLLRGAYVRQVSAGLFSLLPLGQRVIQKIEKIIRDEMNRVEGQEVLMPVVLPRELWEESGRYNTIGAELLRFTDRTGKDMLLGMTHEEAVVHLARHEAFSYRQYPFMLYQIQTKFRDEPRSRGGLIRVREFTMKDAYSFHRNNECLEKTYDKLHEAYIRIFERAGLKQFVSVESDAGMMGGGKSHEFMLVAECGEDSLLLCPNCDYQANREIATMGKVTHSLEEKELSKVATPNCQTIEEVAQFMRVPETQTCKAVFYENAKGQLHLFLIRGDLEVNEAKIRKVMQEANPIMASDELIRSHEMVPGYASAIGTDPSQYRLYLDQSLEGLKDLVAGANEEGYHLSGFQPDRDLNEKDYKWVDIASVPDGAPCPKCSTALEMKRGVEIGNIFQLGDKYTKSMSMSYLDENGKAQTPIMGCYGIGVGRLMAAAIEESHDDYGPIWPESIAPFSVQINALDIGKEQIGEKAEKVYQDFLQKGIDILFDDRGEKPGFQFTDADLLGIPHRLVFSPRNMKEGVVEYRTRADRNAEKIPLDNVVDYVCERLGKG